MPFTAIRPALLPSAVAVLSAVISLQASNCGAQPQAATGPAQADSPGHLFTTVADLDKRLFDAYNTCDLKTLGSLVSEDLEFYHDKTGLAVGRTAFLTAIQNNICGKIHRTLTPGSLEVHPLAHYGAVEIGMHTFSHPGIDTDQGQAKFISLWHYKDGSWQLTRVISYDHEGLPAPKASATSTTPNPSARP